MIALLALLFASEASALLLYAEGTAGGLGAPDQTAGPSATGPLVLPETVEDAGGRYAEATVEVGAGVVRLSTTAGADIGAQSVGSFRAIAKGSWEDTIVFNVDSSIPSLPGVDITMGMTEGTAQLVVDLTGSFFTASNNNIARAGYSASLGYGLLAPFAGRCCGPKWTDFRGEVNLSGDQDGALAPARQWNGDELPDELILDVTFTVGEAFDVIFELSSYAEVGWEGLAREALFASAQLGESAVWQGVRNVNISVDDGLGGTTNVPIPDGTWSFTSDDVDYTAPVPEPSTALLLGLGLVFMARRRRPALGRAG